MSMNSCALMGVPWSGVLDSKECLLTCGKTGLSLNVDVGQAPHPEDKTQLL